MSKLLIITQTVDEQDQLLGFFLSWIRRFAKKFDRVIVLCLNKGEYSLPDNVAVYSLGKDRGVGKLRQLFTFYFLLFTLKTEYDSVFIHMNPIWVILGGPFWRLAGKKIFFWYTSGGVTPKLKMAEKFADTILTASKESFRLPSKKVVVIGHGIDTELFRPSEVRPQGGSRTDLLPRFDLGELRPKLKILSVGRIAPVKNYEVLIDAAKILKDKGFNFAVTMVGETPLAGDKNYEESLKFKVRGLKLEENFNFVGKINHKDLPAQYQSHDIFVHLSKTGSLDKTILEAMACGNKVLSSNDASRAFLAPEFIFNENNAVDLAEKIISSAGTDPDGKLREYVVQNHGLDRLIDKLSSIIQS